MKYAILAADNR